MSADRKIQELAEHFRLLGAKNPEGWAGSQIREGIPQYARFVFLREAWKSVVVDGDSTWIDEKIAQSKRDIRRPGAGIGPALERLLAISANREDITEVVRVMQWHVLSRLAYQLADAGTVDYPDEKLPRVNWALFESDEKGQPVGEIGGLHESVLATEPSGREMRPKGITKEG